MRCDDSEYYTKSAELLQRMDENCFMRLEHACEMLIMKNPFSSNFLPANFRAL